MIQTKTLQLLRTFTARDRRRFGEYLDSPFFNKREDLRVFYRVLLRWAPEFASDDLVPEQVWAAYAPGKAPDAKQLSYLMNFLLRAAEGYLGAEMAAQSPIQHSTAALRHYLSHGLDKHYRALANRTGQLLNRQTDRAGGWHFLAWQLEDLNWQHAYRTRSRSAVHSPTQAMQHLDTFYLDKKLEMASEALNLSHILSNEIDSGFVPPLLEFVDGQPATAEAVKIRRQVLEILQNPADRSAFDALRSLLPRAAKIFPPEKAKGILLYAQNHCIRRIKAGEIAYQQALFELYRESITTGLVYDDGQISPWRFKNICSAGLQLGAFEWVKEFIESQQEHLATEFRDNAMAFNRGHLSFHLGEWEACLKNLQKVAFSDVFYALDTRRIQLKVFFEQGETEAFLSLASAFRTFLRRHKVVSKTNRQAYKNFVDWTVRVYRAREHGDHLSLSQIAKAVGVADPLVERDWIKSRCEEKF